MNGKEIMEHISRAEMPNIEQVRMNCLTQSETKPRLRLRSIKVTVIIAACFLMFSTVAYAVNHVVNQNRLVTGGNVDIVAVPSDYLEREDRHSIIAYANPNSDVIAQVYPWAVRDDRENRFSFDVETAQTISAMLENRVFTADGNTFELMSQQLYSIFYWGDCKGNTLFNEHGQEIGVISIIMLNVRDETNGDGFTVEDVVIKTVAQVEAEYMPLRPSSLEQAIEFLGRDFRVPTVHLESYDPPEFRIHPNHFPGEVMMVFINPNNTLPDATDIMINIENIIDEDHEPGVLLLPEGVFTRLEIAGVTVYEITAGEESFPWFTWQHEGLVYTFHPPLKMYPEIVRIFTDQQLREIIASMVE